MIALQSQHDACRARRRGFSLVEMMIVAGIVAVLVALLLPTLGKARAKAKQTDCASQLHQIYLASESWRVDAEKQTPPPFLTANGWGTMLAPYVTDLRIYNCPETAAGATGQAATPKDKGDTMATPGGTTPGTSGTPGSSGSSGTGGNPNQQQQPSLADAYVEIDPHNGNKWDVPIKEGPWFQKKNAKPGYYELWLEDQGFAGGGDKDFKDVAVAVQDNGDGTCTLSIIPIQKGLPGYDSYVKAPGQDGQPKTIFGGPNGMYKAGGDQPGKTASFSGPFDPNDPTSGSQPTSGSSGSSTPGVVGTVGSADANADYGMNANVREVYGNSDKVLAMDYTGSVVKTTDDWSKAPFTQNGGARPVFARHMGYANLLYADGSVRPAPVSATQFNPTSGDNAKVYWNPK